MNTSELKQMFKVFLLFVGGVLWTMIGTILCIGGMMSLITQHSTSVAFAIFVGGIIWAGITCAVVTVKGKEFKL